LSAAALVAVSTMLRVLASVTLAAAMSLSAKPMSVAVLLPSMSQLSCVQSRRPLRSVVAPSPFSRRVSKSVPVSVRVRVASA